MPTEIKQTTEHELSPIKVLAVFLVWTAVVFGIGLALGAAW